MLVKRPYLNNKLKSFLDDFAYFCKIYNINLAGIEIDHICYKCSSNKEYEQVRSLFEFNDLFIYQSIISDRRISFIGFKKPMKSICGNVFYLELSDQKPDNSQISTVDHIELIPIEISYEEMLKRFSLPNISIEENTKPHHITHDIKISQKLKIKLAHGRLVDKIYQNEMKIYIDQ